VTLIETKAARAAQLRLRLLVLLKQASTCTPQSSSANRIIDNIMLSQRQVFVLLYILPSFRLALPTLSPLAQILCPKPRGLSDSPVRVPSSWGLSLCSPFSERSRTDRGSVLSLSLLSLSPCSAPSEPIFVVIPGLVSTLTDQKCVGFNLLQHVPMFDRQTLSCSEYI
jgi:hypothetical protein